MPYQADEHEKEILEFWRKNSTFEKSVTERPADKPYVFYDGPPFATGLPHYGHILSSVIKDVVPRYWTMKGYRVRRRWGWDCHGLPIESLIEKELKISGKQEIEAKIGVKEFNDTCRSKVLMYTREWKKMVERIGRWVEFDNSYQTMDTTYMESVWWALKTIWDKGLIYEGRKVLMYCPRCETPVSKAEVAMDHSYRDVTEESVVVKFEIRNSKFEIKGPVYLLAWTTTPWTLPGNVALAVGEDIEYAVVREQGTGGEEHYIVAKDLADKVFIREKFETLKVVEGKDLVGLEYEPLFDMPAMLGSGKKVHYVAAGDFVSTDEGTGIVHTAVIYGEDDYNLGLKLDLPMVPTLDESGHFNEAAPEFLRGRYFKEAEKEITKYLAEQERLFSSPEKYTHSYPHCWRCDTQLIYNAVSSWFINIQQVKERMIRLNEKINWFPEHLKHGRFLNIVKEAPDWNISRNRYWATALPFWRCANIRTVSTNIRTAKKSQQLSPEADQPLVGTISSQQSCNKVVCIGSIDELKQRARNFVDVFGDGEVDLHKHFMDQIVLRCDACGGEMHRVPEVLDSWVEAAAMPFAEWHYPFENKLVFEGRFPGQYIAEYIAQTRTWFYYMHAISVILFDEISFENVVTTGTILNDKGEKLSKSKRNFTDPWVIIEQYGVDALRYYLLTSVVMQAENLFFQEREVREAYNKVINILWNVVEFYKQYAVDQKSEIRNQKSEHILDHWILARLQELVKEVTDHMDNYDTVRAGRPIKEFIDDLSTWYVRRSRGRFKFEGEDKIQALATLRQVLLVLSKVTAPFIPFISEMIYQRLQTPNSVHLESWPEADDSLIDYKLIENMAKARKIVEMGMSLRKEAGIRVRQPLSQLSVSYQLSAHLKPIVADELNVKEVIESAMAGDDWVTKEGAGVKVALNTKITESLKKEGLAREIVRAINELRKEQKLTRENVVVVGYSTDDELLNKVFEECSEEIKRQTLAEDITRGGAGQIIEIDGKKVTLGISVRER